MTDTAQKTAAVAVAPRVTMAQILPWVVATVFLCAMPFLVPSNSGITIMNQMAITIIFGLLFATIILLIFVPVIFQLLFRSKPSDKRNVIARQ